MKTGIRTFQARYASTEPMLQASLPTADEWLRICADALYDVVDPLGSRSMWAVITRSAEDAVFGPGLRDRGRSMSAGAMYHHGDEPQTEVSDLRFAAMCSERHDAAIGADVLDIWLTFQDPNDFSQNAVSEFMAATVMTIELAVATAMGPELYRDGASRYLLTESSSRPRLPSEDFDARTPRHPPSRSPEVLFADAMKRQPADLNFRGAEDLYQEVIDSYDPEWAPLAARTLGDMRRCRKDFAGAAAAYRVAIDSRHMNEAPYAAGRLGELLDKEVGDVEGAIAAYQYAVDSGHSVCMPAAAVRVGRLRESKPGDFEGAESAYLLAIDTGNVVTKAVAANRLGDMRQFKQHDYDGAADAYSWAMDSRDKHASRAAFRLGVILETHRGDLEKAAAAYRAAIEFGHPKWAPEAKKRLDDLPESVKASDPDERHLLSSRMSAEDKALTDQILSSWRDCADWATRCAAAQMPTASDRESSAKRARSVDYVIAKGACEAGGAQRWDQLDAREQARRIRVVTAARRTRNAVEHRSAAVEVSALHRDAAELVRHSELLDSLSPGQLVVTAEELSTYLAGFG